MDKILVLSTHSVLCRCCCKLKFEKNLLFFLNNVSQLDLWLHFLVIRDVIWSQKSCCSDSPTGWKSTKVYTFGCVNYARQGTLWPRNLVLKFTLKHWKGDFRLSAWHHHTLSLEDMNKGSQWHYDVTSHYKSFICYSYFLLVCFPVATKKTWPSSGISIQCLIFIKNVFTICFKIDVTILQAMA